MILIPTNRGIEQSKGYRYPKQAVEGTGIHLYDISGVNIENRALTEERNGNKHLEEVLVKKQNKIHVRADVLQVSMVPKVFYQYTPTEL